MLANGIHFLLLHNMKNNKSYIFLILSSLLFAYGCCCYQSSRSFTDNELRWMPNNNEDSLVFKNFKSDSGITLFTYDKIVSSFNLHDNFKYCTYSCFVSKSIQIGYI